MEEFNNQVCPECQLTADNIRDHEVSCRGFTNHIVYKAMVVGTEVRTAMDLVSLIYTWVASGRASITALSIRLHLDKDCSTVLDNLDEPVCPLQIESTTQPTVLKVTTPKPEEKGSTDSSKPVVAAKVRTGEIVGFLFGAVVIILLAVLIIVIIIVAFKKFQSKPTKR